MLYTLILAYGVLDVNETLSGKKSAGVEDGAENSIEPDFVEASITGKDQTKVFRRASCVYCPSHSLTIGMHPIGRGMLIWTSFNSRSACSNSYSIFTSQPPSPFSEGQQFTAIYKQLIKYLKIS